MGSISNQIITPITNCQHFRLKQSDTEEPSVTLVVFAGVRGVWGAEDRREQERVLKEVEVLRQPGLCTVRNQELR